MLPRTPAYRPTTSAISSVIMRTWSVAQLNRAALRPVPTPTTMAEPMMMASSGMSQRRRNQDSENRRLYAVAWGGADALSGAAIGGLDHANGVSLCSVIRDAYVVYQMVCRRTR